MELLIFSDSHGREGGMREALARQIRRPDAVCFLGDGLRDAEALSESLPLLYTVRGNCDWGILGDGYPTERCVQLLGHTLLLTHGHGQSVKSGLGALIAQSVRVGADIALYGHTHSPDLTVIGAGESVCGKVLERPMYLFNPGSIGQGCFGTLHLTEDTVLFSHGCI